jgi:hypothetical protein
VSKLEGITSLIHLVSPVPRVPFGRKAQWSMVRRARAMRKVNKGIMAVENGLDEGVVRQGRGRSSM